MSDDANAPAQTTVPTPDDLRRAKCARKSKSDAQFYDRLSQVARLLGQSRTKGDIKRIICAPERLTPEGKNVGGFGISPRTAETYLSRARAMMLAETGKPKTEHVAEAYFQYIDVLANKSATIKEKLDARAAIREMLGLDERKQVDVTSGGKPFNYDSLSEAEINEMIVNRQETLRRVEETPPAPEQHGKAPTPA